MVSTSDNEKRQTPPPAFPKRPPGRPRKYPRDEFGNIIYPDGRRAAAVKGALKDGPHKRLAVHEPAERLHSKDTVEQRTRRIVEERSKQVALVLKKLKERGGVEWVYMMVASGASNRDLSRMIGAPDYLITQTLDRLPPEYRDAVDRGRRDRAHHLAEETMALSDGVAAHIERLQRDIEQQNENLSPSEQRHYIRERLMALKEQTISRRFLSAAFDPDRFRAKPQESQLSVNMTVLHLDALRQKRVEESKPIIDVTPNERA